MQVTSRTDSKDETAELHGPEQTSGLCQRPARATSPRGPQQSEALPAPPAAHTHTSLTFAHVLLYF